MIEIDSTEEALLKECKKFGPATIDRFSTCYRVWFGAHCHRGAVSGDLCGYGATIKEALENALAQANDVQPMPCRLCAEAPDWS
jgi:hypothetical protein